MMTCNNVILGSFVVVIVTKSMQRFRSTEEKTGKLTLGFFLTITGWESLDLSFFFFFLCSLFPHHHWVGVITALISDFGNVKNFSSSLGWFEMMKHSSSFFWLGGHSLQDLGYFGTERRKGLRFLFTSTFIFAFFPLSLSIFYFHCFGTERHKSLCFLSTFTFTVAFFPLFLSTFTIFEPRGAKVFVFFLLSLSFCRSFYFHFLLSLFWNREAQRSLFSFYFHFHSCFLSTSTFYIYYF